MNRRKFITIAGTCAVMGFAAKQTFEVFAGNDILNQNGKYTNKRWAMLVNLKVCQQHEDCHICLDACNNTHNVPKIQDKNHEVKWIWKEPYENAFIEQENEFIPEEIKKKHVLLMCNHCKKPPCVNVCPTKATWQREDGIVMMDWHRCIGCRYCMAACPYGSRSFNWIEPRPYIEHLNSDFPSRTKGVVEKCTFCEERLVKNLKPACVDACPFGALKFGNLKDDNSEIRQTLSNSYSVIRKPELGTHPEVYYLI